MTNNINYYDLQLLLAQQTSQGVGADKVGDNDGLNFPYSGSDPWSTQVSFDTSIPYNSDGTIDINALLERLREILYYSNQGDPMDYNSMLDIAAFIMNIGGVWSQIESQGAASQVEQYLKLPFNGQPLLQAIAPTIMGALIHGTFYQSNGNTGTTDQFAQQLIQSLENIVNNSGGSNSPFSSLLTAAEDLVGPTGSTSTLDAWMQQHLVNGQTDISFSAFTFNMGLQWENTFSYNTNTTNFENSWRSQELADILDQPGVQGNPFLEYVLIMYVLMNENGDLQTQIGGDASQINALSNGFGADTQSILSAFTSGNFTASSAQQFYNEVVNLKALSQDQRFSSIAPQISQLYNDLCSSGSQVTVNIPTYTNPNDPSESYPAFNGTLGQLFQDIENGQNGFNGTNGWGALAAGLNSLQPQTSASGNNPPPVTPGGFSTLSNDINQITTSITNRSSAMGQIVQNIEGVNEKDLAMITAAANEIVDPEKTINQNMSAAGN